MSDQPGRTERVVNVRLPADLHCAVQNRAKAEDRTMAQTIRVAIRHYLQSTNSTPTPKD